MAKVIILCGKIASGKTFYANQLRDKNNGVILSVDDLMLMLSDSCLGEHHDDMALRCERYFYKLSEQILPKGLDVIIDFGYWSRTEREEAKEYFKRRGIPAELHYIRIPEEKRLKQLESRNARLLSELKTRRPGRVYIIEEALRQRLDQKFEEPSDQEVDALITKP